MWSSLTLRLRDASSRRLRAGHQAHPDSLGPQGPGRYGDVIPDDARREPSKKHLAYTWKRLPEAQIWLEIQFWLDGADSVWSSGVEVASSI